MRNTIIEAKNLAIGYRSSKQSHVIHSALNFELSEGQLVCLLGANGAGKSTLLRTLAAAQLPLEGELMLMGHPVRSYTERERARLIGLVLTDRTYAGGLSVRELVSLGRYPHTGFFGRLTRNDRERVDYAMEAVGIACKAFTPVSEISDGERQKVMIAKALAQECPLVILDEPTAFLDVVSRMEIMSLLHRLAVEENRAILLSTHDVEQALLQADRLWLLNDRLGMECGTTEDLVLDHCMDRLFRHSDIRFDLRHGAYVPVSAPKRYICLEAADDVLLHWTKNALNRNGFLAASADNLCSGETQGLFLKVDSRTEFRLTMHSVETAYHSFSDLLDVLSVAVKE